MDAAANTAFTKRCPGPLSPFPYFLPKIRSYILGRSFPIRQTEGESRAALFGGEKLLSNQDEICFTRLQKSSSRSSERNASHWGAIKPASSGEDTPNLYGVSPGCGPIFPAKASPLSETAQKSGERLFGRDFSSAF